eukprot:g4618.t1
MVSKSELAARRWSSRLILFTCFVAIGFIVGLFGNGKKATSPGMRRLAAVNETYSNLEACKLDLASKSCGQYCSCKDVGCNIVASDYPSDLFTVEQCNNGAIILHIIGLFYMFLGLSIICDEFFVPALEEMTFNRLKLDADVAGATFMAAGGSAPELATSFIGTFTGSSVGFGTIVGSAVFNVLFVIGACAMASKEILTLTAYPLARDATWYTICLGFLAYFFANSPSESVKVTADGPQDFIEFPEALVQFLLYVGYVIIMANNKKLKAWFNEKFINQGAANDAEKSGDVEMPSMSGNPIQDGESTSRKAYDKSKSKSIDEEDSGIRVQGYFNASIFKLMTQKTSMNSTLASFAVAKITGSMRETFDELDEEKNGKIEVQNVKHLLQRMGGKHSDDQVQKYMEELDTDKSGDISFEEFSVWYLRGEARIEQELDETFDDLDVNNNGYLGKKELIVLMERLGHPVAEEPKIIDDMFALLDSNKDNQISKDEFTSYYRENEEYMDHKKKQAEKEHEIAQQHEEEEEGGNMLEWPADADLQGKIMFIIAFPLVLLFCITIPDVRKEGKFLGIKFKDFYIYSFLMSIAMVGVLSYIMVWLAVTIGKQWNIPDEIMGLTFLAAGTSVPDLLTSILVAMQGEGDMAVSSSIGSNIFDVTVGLPVPWIFYTAIKNEAFPVGADGVGTSIIILILMLVAVIVCIASYGWKMTKPLGYSMFCLYILFVIQDLLRNPTLNWWPAFQVINF